MKAWQIIGFTFYVYFEIGRFGTLFSFRLSNVFCNGPAHTYVEYIAAIDSLVRIAVIHKYNAYEGGSSVTQ